MKILSAIPAIHPQRVWKQEHIHNRIGRAKKFVGLMNKSQRFVDDWQITLFTPVHVRPSSPISQLPLWANTTSYESTLHTGAAHSIIYRISSPIYPVSFALDSANDSISNHPTQRSAKPCVYEDMHLRGRKHKS